MRVRSERQKESRGENTQTTWSGPEVHSTWGGIGCGGMREREESRMTARFLVWIRGESVLLKGR